jgi:hypothetical protein
MDPVEIMTAIQIKRDAVKQNRIAIKEKMMLLTLLFCSDLHDPNKILKTFYKKNGNNFVPIFHDFVRQVRPFPFFIFDFQNKNTYATHGRI